MWTLVAVASVVSRVRQVGTSALDGDHLKGGVPGMDLKPILYRWCISTLQSMVQKEVSACRKNSDKCLVSMQERASRAGQCCTVLQQAKHRYRMLFSFLFLGGLSIHWYHYPLHKFTWWNRVGFPPHNLQSPYCYPSYFWEYEHQEQGLQWWSQCIGRNTRKQGIF